MKIDDDVLRYAEHLKQAGIKVSAIVRIVEDVMYQRLHPPPLPEHSLAEILPEVMADILSRKPGDEKPRWKDPAFLELYRQTLLSERWKQMRRVMIVRADGRCEGCGIPHARLDMHHKSYARLGREFVEDLQVLCRHCHERLHGHPMGGTHA